MSDFYQLVHWMDCYGLSINSTNPHELPQLVDWPFQELPQRIPLKKGTPNSSMCYTLQIWHFTPQSQISSWISWGRNSTRCTLLEVCNAGPSRRKSTRELPQEIEHSMSGLSFWCDDDGHVAKGMVIVILLLMEEILGCRKTCKYWDKLPNLNWSSMISEPSTVRNKNAHL